MTVLQIITDVDRLQRVAEPCQPEHFGSIARDLLDTAQKWRFMPGGCLGLAAPQIGYNLRMFVMHYEGDFTVIINPEIIKGSGGKIHKAEGCLSRPGINTRVARFKRLRVKYTDPSGETVTRNFTKMNARVFQHEFDHLNGILI